MSLARKIILIAGLSLILAGVTFMIIKSEMGANEAILPSSEDSATTTNEDGCAVDQISAGLDHYLVLKDDGTVWAWGDNSEGQLGTSNLLSQANPTQITPLKNIKLMTNNPTKVVGLEGYGLNIVKRVALEIPPNERNRGYLKTKKLKMGHLLRHV